MKKKKKTIFSDILLILKTNRTIRNMIISIAVFDAIVSVILNFGQAMFKDIGISTETIAIVYTISSLLGFFSNLFAYKLVNLIGRVKTILLGFSFMLFIFIFVAIPNNWLVIVAFILMRVMYYICSGTLDAIFQDKISSELRASLISISSMLCTSIMSLTFLLIGFIASKVRLTYLFGGLGVLSVLLVIFLLKYENLFNDKDSDLKSS